MDKPFSRKQLALELVRRGVMPSYAWRVSGELADHAEDISAAGLETSARLGDVDRLANQIVAAYRQRTFAGRHPVLAFVVAPLPLMLLAYAAYWFVGALVIFGSMKLTEFTSIAVLAVNAGAMFLPAMGAAGLICRSARRAGLSWRFTVFACLPVLVLAFGILFSTVRLDSLAHGTFTIGISLPWLGSALRIPSLVVPLGNRFAQLALPICVMFWMFVRERRQAREILLKSAQHDAGDASACDSYAADITRAA